MGAHRAVAAPRGVYTTNRVANVPPIALEVVNKIANQVLPRRRVVEGIFARSNRNQHLAKAPEAGTHSAVAFLYAASIILFTRRLARST